MSQDFRRSASISAVALNGILAAVFLGLAITATTKSDSVSSDHAAVLWGAFVAQAVLLVATCGTVVSAHKKDDKECGTSRNVSAQGFAMGSVILVGLVAFSVLSIRGSDMDKPAQVVGTAIGGSAGVALITGLLGSVSFKN